MKTINVRFCDLWENFDEKDNFFTQLLKDDIEFNVSENPDYIIYSVFGNKHLELKGIKIFFSGENIVPDFNLCDYGVSFSHLRFEDRYLRYPLYSSYFSDYEKAKEKHLITVEEIEQKKEFCSFVYSNASGHEIRELFFHQLSEYKKVNSGGAFLNNIGGKRVDDKYEFQKKHRFSIAFENSSTNGYCTEKLIQAFAANTVPIYWGDPLASKYFNPKSFINIHDFKNIDEAIKCIVEIDQDEQAYLSMLKQPIFNDQLIEIDYNKNLREFLLSIFEQDKENAVRREQYMWGKKYENLAVARERAFYMSQLKWYTKLLLKVPLSYKIKIHDFLKKMPFYTMISNVLRKFKII